MGRWFRREHKHAPVVREGRTFLTIYCPDCGMILYQWRIPASWKEPGS